MAATNENLRALLFAKLEELTLSGADEQAFFAIVDRLILLDRGESAKDATPKVEEQIAQLRSEIASIRSALTLAEAR